MRDLSCGLMRSPSPMVGRPRSESQHSMISARSVPPSPQMLPRNERSNYLDVPRMSGTFLEVPDFVPSSPARSHASAKEWAQDYLPPYMNGKNAFLAKEAVLA